MLVFSVLEFTEQVWKRFCQQKEPWAPAWGQKAEVVGGTQQGGFVAEANVL